MSCLLIGVIGKAHGLRGEVVVHPHHAASPLWAPGTELTSFNAPEGTPNADLVEAPAGATRRIIAKIRRVPGGHLIVHFRGVESRESAEALRGQALGVAPEALPRAGADEVYHHELRGWAAIRLGGSPLGTVRGVMNLPAQDVLEIATPDGKEALVPFVDAFVVRIDRPARTLVLDPPFGLFPGEDDDPGAG